MPLVTDPPPRPSPAPGRPHALVTGASKGIGRDLALQLADRGYDLVLVARDQAALERLAETLRARGVGVHPLGADLARPGAAERLAATVEGLGIAPEILVNNAGFGATGDLAATSIDQAGEMIQLNIAALVELTQRLLPGMRRRGRGRILQVASVAVFMPIPSMAVYAASKAFVLSFSQALAWELRGSGITVTALCPGATSTGFAQRAGASDTPMFTSPLVMAPERVAALGLRALFSGRPVVVTGTLNRLLVAAAGLLPRAWVLRIAQRQAVPAGPGG
jgi:short-subunit dehydrogenase